MPGARRVSAASSVAFTVVVTVLVVVGALVILAILALSGAPGSVVLATLLAAVPVGPIVACYLWLDRYEPEPRTLLAAGLLWGCFVATAAAILLQGIGGVVGGFTDTQTLEIVAPVTEEACKGLFLLLLLWWRRAELDGILDGIVYAGMVGVGFAFTENILYLAAAYNGTDGMGPGGTEAVTATFVLRCLISPFAHPLFTTFIGIGVGLAVNSRRGSGRVLWPAAGYVCAVVAHAVWNTSTAYGLGHFALAYVVLMAPALISVISLAVWSRRSERRMLAAALTDAATRGLVPATDIGWVVDLTARRRSRAYARERGGPAAERAMRDYQQAAIELGFLHYRYLRGTPPPDYAARGQRFLQRIDALRPSIAFPGQVVPTR
ncbi:PrsW family intramembrane metalloprotease [Nocardioides sp. LMS-CY]|uniref:RsiW-degrading membrane proteinase PrsW (M82 family) n=1 Tax=Nocardioides soli TaxID=1036020 RepID=A0A7W4Z0Y2_9ACTN|nr:MULTISPECIES: PrsW family intramembrane metalloprotease [Nocardioides]MBB3040955.1 RsiW-degrading membrane proteinase PrsW (M82 family) [Nocardioides soli]QWF23639.1 PrsW family intramembrane metalloprotease [Nocardioides sp. LMS-CY]